MQTPGDLSIDFIEIYKLDIPLKIPFRIAFETIRHAQNLLIRIHANNGLVGCGESSPYKSILGESQESQFALAPSLAKSILEKNPLEIENRITDLDGTISGNPCLKSAFDIALYDLSAQQAQMPLYQFLGGANDRTLQSDMTVGLESAEIMAKRAKEFALQGFPAIKIKLGTTLKEDVTRIRAIREAIGPKLALRIDANQGWSPSNALAILNAITPYNIEHCEAPISKKLPHALAELQRLSPIPIMADESLFSPEDAYQLARNNACAYFNIKLAKSGGIFQATKIAHIADAAGIPCQVGCFSESKIATSALAHFALAHKNIIHFDMDAPLMLAEDPVIGGINYDRNGKIHIGEKPGIGAKIDPDYLKKLEQITIR